MELIRLADSGARCIDAYYLTSAGSAEFPRVFIPEFYRSFRKFCGEVQQIELRTTVSMPNIDVWETSISTQELVIKWTCVFLLMKT